MPRQAAPAPAAHPPRQDQEPEPTAPNLAAPPLRSGTRHRTSEGRLPPGSVLAQRRAGDVCDASTRGGMLELPDRKA